MISTFGMALFFFFAFLFFFFLLGPRASMHTYARHPSNMLFLVEFWCCGVTGNWRKVAHLLIRVARHSSALASAGFVGQESVELVIGHA